MHYQDKLERLPQAMRASFEEFFHSWEQAAQQNGHTPSTYYPLLNQFIDLAVEQHQHPFRFPLFHRSIRQPVDYYRFGLDFLRPLVQFDRSTLLGRENLDKISLQIAQGENVILFANHQIEPDPQAISLLLEDPYPFLAEQMIFIAGHRVVSDPLSIPFSMGRNLLCIYSKNYIDHPKEKKREKLLHNQRTMKAMRDLLAEGGKCIYVAPSGGRDRPDRTGTVNVSPFDPQSIEMFYFIAKISGVPTHFYPLALATFDLLPPPQALNLALGEVRKAYSSPIHAAFGSEIAIDAVTTPEGTDKKLIRNKRASLIEQEVKALYRQITGCP